jgi:AraC-like DNA-binding protein
MAIQWLPMSDNKTVDFDLEEIEQSQRSGMWKHWHEQIFSARVNLKQSEQAPSAGILQGRELAEAFMFRMLCVSNEVEFKANKNQDSTSFNLMLQLQGTSQIKLEDSDHLLQPGDIALFENTSNFQILHNDISEVICLLVPRERIEKTFPSCPHNVALQIDGTSTVGALLRNAVVSAFDSAYQLHPSQKHIVLRSVLELIGLLLETVAPSRDQKRIKKAVQYIKLNLGDPEMNANKVAEHTAVSRRHLDSLFLNELGESVSASIWSFRLQHAAESLSSPLKQNQSVTDICYEVGFGDPAHFSRSFKKQFGISPAAWRQRAG